MKKLFIVLLAVPILFVASCGGGHHRYGYGTGVQPLSMFDGALK